MPFVIIADDDEMVVDIVRAALEARGHVVGVLSDGKPVRSLVELKRPDVVILDCAMAEVSGILALKDIRASEEAYATPVLILTGRRGAADEHIAWAAGADDYLRKPFDPDELVARVEVLIDKHAAAQSRRANSLAARAYRGSGPCPPSDRSIRRFLTPNCGREHGACFRPTGCSSICRNSIDCSGLSSSPPRATPKSRSRPIRLFRKPGCSDSLECANAPERSRMLTDRVADAVPRCGNAEPRLATSVYMHCPRPGPWPVKPRARRSYRQASRRFCCLEASL